MKKLLLASLLGLATIPALAATGNVYVQGDLGYSKASLDGGSSDNAFTQRLSVGYDFGNGLRVAGDFTNFAKMKGSYAGIAYSFKVKSFGVSTFYDFTNNSRFTPYIGARVSYNHASVDITQSIQNPTIELETGSSSGFGVLGGVQTKLTDKVSINAGLEYNRLFADVSQFGANLGLRYNF